MGNSCFFTKKRLVILAIIAILGFAAGWFGVNLTLNMLLGGRLF